jgi:hypothetical protein
MSQDGPANRDDESSVNRRQFLQWASTVGLAAFAQDTVTEVAKAFPEKGDPDEDPVPESERGDPTNDSNVTHVLELPGIRRQIDEFEENGDPKVFYNDGLESLLQNDPGKNEFSIVVRTLGEEITKTSSGPYQRTINGWRPTQQEIKTLNQYGKITWTADFASTTVSMEKVSRETLPKIASLDFVVQISYDPEIKPMGIDITKIRSTDYTWFSYEDGDYDLPSHVSIGIIDTGYEGSETPCSSTHAKDIGLDTSLAKDFTNDGDWSNDTYMEANNMSYSHGTAVADISAYMLDDSACHSETFVPLKIWDDGDSSTSAADRLRSALEYAYDNGIDVANISAGWQKGSGARTYCNEQFCSELDTYCNSGGYIAVAASGNAGDENGVDQPGGSWLTVNTGGSNENSCTEDYHRHPDSNYCDSYDWTTCSWCNQYDSSGHTPIVYSPYSVTTDAGKTIDGTSFSAPVAAACGVIMQANLLYNYQSARDIYYDMSYYSVCHDSSSMVEHITDAEYADRKTE